MLVFFILCYINIWPMWVYLSCINTDSLAIKYLLFQLWEPLVPFSKYFRAPSFKHQWQNFIFLPHVKLNMTIGLVLRNMNGDDVSLPGGSFKNQCTTHDNFFCSLLATGNAPVGSCQHPVSQNKDGVEQSFWLTPNGYLMWVKKLTLLF